jgi:hypothetical protein
MALFRLKRTEKIMIRNEEWEKKLEGCGNDFICIAFLGII